MSLSCDQGPICSEPSHPIRQALCDLRSIYAPSNSAGQPLHVDPPHTGPQAPHDVEMLDIPSRSDLQSRRPEIAQLMRELEQDCRPASDSSPRRPELPEITQLMEELERDCRATSDQCPRGPEAAGIIRHPIDGAYKPGALPDSGHRPSVLEAPETSTSEASKRSVPQAASRVTDGNSMSSLATIARRQRTHTIVNAIHARMETHGNAWFEELGGRKGVAKKYGIEVEILKCYFLEDGELRPLGDDIVNGASKEPITNDKLLQCKHLRSTGAWPRDGVAAVAKMLNVRYGALRNYFMADGTPRPVRGEKRLESIEKEISVAQRNSYSIEGMYKPDVLPNAGHRPSTRATSETSKSEAQKPSAPQGAGRVTDDTSVPPLAKIARWKRTAAAVKTIQAKMNARGKTWFIEKGGCKGLAAKYGLRPKQLVSYFLQNGDLRPLADDIVNGSSKEPVTDEKLLQCVRLRSAGAWPKDGVKAVAGMLNVRYTALKNYFKNNGTPTISRGQKRLELIKESISVGQEECNDSHCEKSHSHAG